MIEKREELLSVLFKSFLVGYDDFSFAFALGKSFIELVNGGSEVVEQTAASALYAEVSAILNKSRAHAARLVNVEMVQAYWLIGRAIISHEQKGKDRARLR